MTKVYMYSMGFGEIPERIGAVDRLRGGQEIEMFYDHQTLTVEEITARLLNRGLTGDLHTELFGPLYALVRGKVKELAGDAEQVILFWRLPPTFTGGSLGRPRVYCYFSLWVGAAEDVHPHDHKNFSNAREFQWEGWNDISSGAMHITEV